MTSLPPAWVAVGGHRPSVEWCNATPRSAPRTGDRCKVNPTAWKDDAANAFTVRDTQRRHSQGWSEQGRAFIAILERRKRGLRNTITNGGRCSELVRTSIVMLTHTRTGTRTNPHNDTGLCIKKRKTHALCVPSFQTTNTHAAPPVGKGHLTQSGKVISQLPTLPPSVGDSCEVTHKRERINEATHCP